MSRNGSKINRDTSFSTYSNKEPEWVAEYVNAVSKYSVHSKKEDALLFDQINQILGNNKSKYSSVEEAVLDMQKRTGLYELLQKTASTPEPELFSKIPSLKFFIDNHVKSFPGTSIDAVVFNILKVPEFKDALSDNQDVPEDVKNYINSKIAEVNPEDPNDVADHNMGKTDLEMTNELVKSNNPLNILVPPSTV